MASFGSSHLKDIDEKFCQCPICLEQYTEPKLLPCLQRYCSDCLKQIIERNQGVNVISCPECREEFTVSTEGVNGFKTDFHMQNIIEYIQIQKSSEDERPWECYGCSKKSKMAAHCFKCNGFLCEDCYEFHMKNKSLKDHRQHTLCLEDLKSKDMTLKTLGDMKEPPRCESHPEDICKLCCTTCGNRPICGTCVYGSHENHQIKDVRVLTADEKGKLRNQLTSLSHNKDRILAISKTLEKLKTLSNRKKDSVKMKYEENVQMVQREMKKLEDDSKISQTEIQSKEMRKLDEIQKQMENEMKQLKEKYNSMCDEVKQESREGLSNLKQKEEESLHKSREKLTILKTDFQSCMKTCEKRQKEELVKLQEASQKVDALIERYYKLTATGYSVLESSNDWTTMQCIPDVYKAIEPLNEDIKRELHELETLLKSEISPEFTEDKESPLNVEVIRRNEMTISDITGCGDGSIVLTGLSSAKFESHITVIDTDGKSLRQEKFDGTRNLSFRFCAILSPFKVATIGQLTEIGVYDIRDGSYIKKDIRDVISILPVNWRALSVTTDPVNNHILVGGYGSRDVYAFDDQLNYHHTLTLPEMIKYPYAITMSEANLLVCCREGRRAYVVNIEELEGKLIHELTKPDFDGDNWGPAALCTDIDGFKYIMWMSGTSLPSGKCLITQYTEDGRQLLATKQLAVSDAFCIATKVAGLTVKLLVATRDSGKIYIYTVW